MAKRRKSQRMPNRRQAIQAGIAANAAALLAANSPPLARQDDEEESSESSSSLTSTFSSSEILLSSSAQSTFSGIASAARLRSSQHVSSSETAESVKRRLSGGKDLGPPKPRKLDLGD